MIKKKFQNPLLVHLSVLEDPRSGENFRHAFLEIVFITVCTVICGCENWSEIEDYAIRTTGEVSWETRYYISSAKKSASDFNSSVRNHWGIENKLHWSLDVSLREDDSRIWADESGKNFSLLRKMVSTSAQFCEILLNEFFVATVPGEEFGHEGFMRLSFAIDSKKMNEALARMNQLIKSMN